MSVFIANLPAGASEFSGRSRREPHGPARGASPGLRVHAGLEGAEDRIAASRRLRAPERGGRNGSVIVASVRDSGCNPVADGHHKSTRDGTRHEQLSRTTE